MGHGKPWVASVTPAEEESHLGIYLCLQHFEPIAMVVMSSKAAPEHITTVKSGHE